MARALRELRRFLGATPRGETPRAPAEFARAAAAAVWIARGYYLACAYLLATAFAWRDPGEPADPLWPVRLLRALTGGGWMDEAAAITAASSLAALAATLAPGFLPFRLAVFLALFLGGAAANSDGAINHGAHAWIFVAFALLFLPASAGRGKAMPRADAMRCLAAFVLAQALLLLSYSLSGFWKVAVSRLDLFAPDGLVRVALGRAMQDAGPIPPLLPAFASLGPATQALYLGLVCVQFLALLALFRPHLQRPFGVALILFHFGSGWLLDVPFHENVPLLGLFLVLSPLAPRRFSWAGLAQSLPVLGAPFRILAGRGAARDGGKAWLVYDGECPFCSNYARLLDARRAVGELTLVDARAGGPLVAELRRLGHDPDAGMALKLDGRWRLGPDALRALARRSRRRGPTALANRLLFGPPGAARRWYPLLRLARRAALRAKGVAPLR